MHSLSKKGQDLLMHDAGCSLMRTDFSLLLLIYLYFLFIYKKLNLSSDLFSVHTHMPTDSRTETCSAVPMLFHSKIVLLLKNYVTFLRSRARSYILIAEELSYLSMGSGPEPWGLIYKMLRRNQVDVTFINRNDLEIVRS